MQLPSPNLCRKSIHCISLYFKVHLEHECSHLRKRWPLTLRSARNDVFCVCRNDYRLFSRVLSLTATAINRYHLPQKE